MTEKKVPNLCINGCGFFGNPAYTGMCSVCYRTETRKREDEEKKKREEEEAAARLKEEEEEQKYKGRCFKCRKKIGVASTFTCKCKKCFCSLHRMPELHQCSYDYKAEGRQQIAKDNPRIVPKKIDQISPFK